ncbi:YHS domain-containing protein [bacterium]|nr:YHS domain-containing protein [bacterium]
MFKRLLIITLAVFTVWIMADDAKTADKETGESCCGSHKTVVENMQTTCPVMGGEIDKNVYVDHEGARIYFCCQACVETFNKDPETYLNKMKEAGITLYKAPCCENNGCAGCKKHQKKHETKI